MTDPQKALAERFSHALVKAYGPELADEDPRVRPSNNPSFGDYQANVAMGLAKRLGQKPRDIAATIVESTTIATYETSSRAPRSSAW